MRFELRARTDAGGDLSVRERSGLSPSAVSRHASPAHRVPIGDDYTEAPLDARGGAGAGYHHSSAAGPPPDLTPASGCCGSRGAGRPPQLSTPGG